MPVRLAAGCLTWARTRGYCSDRKLCFSLGTRKHLSCLKDDTLKLVTQTNLKFNIEVKFMFFLTCFGIESGTCNVKLLIMLDIPPITLCVGRSAVKTPALVLGNILVKYVTSNYVVMCRRKKISYFSQSY